MAGDCRSGDGRDCEVVIALANSCTAVAAGDDDVLTGEQAGNSETAQEKAMATCAKKGGKNCEIQAWICSLP